MRTVKWSAQAKLDYASNVDYLLEHWSEKEAMRFVASVEKIISDLKSGIVNFMPTNKKDVRRCVVCKQVTLFYRVKNNDRVELIRFWNNYGDTKTLRFQ